MKKVWGGLVGLLVVSPCYSFEFKTDNSGKNPVEIQADSGISCNQETNVCTAQGNVVISQNGVTLKASTVTAYLDKIDENHKTLTRIKCKGNVILESTKDQKKLTANSGYYDIKQGQMEFFGHPVRIDMDKGWIQANESIHYDEKKGLVIARGDAKVCKDGYSMNAPVLVAVLGRDADNKLKIQEVSIQNGFQAHSASDTLTASTGHINTLSKKTIAKGDVHIVRPDGVMMGDTAEADLKKGTGTIQGNNNSRVKVLLGVQ